MIHDSLIKYKSFCTDFVKTIISSTFTKINYRSLTPMSIHTMDMDWPDPVEEPTRWQYAVGTFVINVKEITDTFTPTIRYA